MAINRRAASLGLDLRLLALKAELCSELPKLGAVPTSQVLCAGVDVVEDELVPFSHDPRARTS